MKPSLSLLALTAAALAPATLTAVPALSASATTSAPTANVALSRSTLGPILVDNQGRDALPVRKGQARQELVCRRLRNVLAAAADTRQASRRRGCEERACSAARVAPAV